MTLPNGVVEVRRVLSTSCVQNQSKTSKFTKFSSCVSIDDHKPTVNKDIAKTYLVFSYLKGRARGTGSDRDLSSAGSAPKSLQWPGLGHAEDNSLYHRGGRDPTTDRVTTCCRWGAQHREVSVWSRDGACGCASQS